MKQGEKATHTGKALEDFITNTLIQNGYTLVGKHSAGKKAFDEAREQNEEQRVPIFAKQYPLCKNIYDAPQPLKTDFILYHPEQYPNCLAIESKWQETGGSADEKFPYLVANIREKFGNSVAQ